MIYYVTRSQLNEEKYNHCILKAINTRIYAHCWYLDIVCDDWDVLVKDDYDAVMPLPKRKKFGINYIYQVPWIQQLGVFSKNVIEEMVIFDFIKSIPNKYKFIDLLFNSGNPMKSKHVTIRDNFIIKLTIPYEIIKRSYNKGRKSSIKQAKKYNLTIEDHNGFDKIIELFKQNKGNKLKENLFEYELLAKIMNRAMELNLAKSYAITNDKKELIGGAFFLIDNYRITYLFSAINDEGRKKQVMSFLINFMIKYYANSNYVLDFEGSMIKKLASFFKSFGAERETYYHFKRFKLLPK